MASDPLQLLKQFRKGCDFFNREMLAGPATPYLRRKMVEFERAVIVPLDAACAAMKPEERAALQTALELSDVPF